MRLAGCILLAALLMVSLLFWTRSTKQQTRLVQPTSPTSEASSHSQHPLAPVEVATQRASAPDPVVEISPADYEPEDPILTTLSTELDADLRGIEVAGTVVISPAWNEVKPQVILCRVGATDREIVRAQPVREQPGSKPDSNSTRWHASVQGAGRYWVGTIDPASVMEIEVTGDLNDVRIVLPDPVQMECFVVDARTQQPVTAAHVSYGLRVPFAGSGTERVRPDASTPGLYRWRCAMTDGVVFCSSRTQGYEDQRVDCHTFTRSLRIELVPITGIRIRATSTGKPSSEIKMPDLAGCLVVERAGVPVQLRGALTTSQRAILIKVPSPDTYVVRVDPAPKGYRSPPPRTVVTREQECSEVLFELEPE